MLGVCPLCMVRCCLELGTCFSLHNLHTTRVTFSPLASRDRRCLSLPSSFFSDSAVSRCLPVSSLILHSFCHRDVSWLTSFSTE